MPLSTFSVISVVSAASAGLVVWCEKVLVSGMYYSVFYDKHISLVHWPKSACVTISSNDDFLYIYSPVLVNKCYIYFDLLLVPFVSLFATHPSTKDVSITHGY